jgi:hypothetical protein
MNKYLEKIAESSEEDKKLHIARGVGSTIGGAIGGGIIGRFAGSMLSGAHKFPAGRAQRLVAKGGARAGGLYGLATGALDGAKKFKESEGIKD